MTQHSPQPWSIGPEYGNARDEVLDADGCTVAVVWTRKGQTPYASARCQFHNSDTGPSNLTLIAAAPDMLAQLESIQGRLAAMKRAAAGAYCTPAQFIREWLSDDAGLQETINKAKGEVST